MPAEHHHLTLEDLAREIEAAQRLQKILWCHPDQLDEVTEAVNQLPAALRPEIRTSVAVTRNQALLTERGHDVIL